jgi:catechol 2,3-dioxygenase-like lactoylglutathione lyase family enzyme
MPGNGLRSFGAFVTACEVKMPINLNGRGQIALGVRDVDASERFYGDVLGLRKLFRFGTLSFFDMAGVRLLLEQERQDARIEHGGILYFRVADIVVARTALEARGLTFRDQIHRIAQMEDHDLWMTFFSDPDGHILALMMEAPKG